MQKTIFHGSEQIIKKPRFHSGNPHNDYGYGFYCTESEELAIEWAVTREHDGYAKVASRLFRKISFNHSVAGIQLDCRAFRSASISSR